MPHGESDYKSASAEDGEEGLLLKHAIPNIGLVEFPVYAPADELLDFMKETGELGRLMRLKHVGALESALPGISHTRWDYAMSMLYVASRIQVPGGRCRFNIEKANFSSAIAAVQCAALLSNVGHLPGTFAVEKGLARYVWTKNRQRPLEELRALLAMTGSDYKPLDRLREPIRRYLWESDYNRINRVLALLKGAQWVVEKDLPEGLAHVVRDFHEWLLLPDLCDPSPQRQRVYRLFEAIRRLSYLNLDSSFSDAPVQVLIGRLVGGSGAQESSTVSIEDLERTMEVLSAYEHVVYQHVYHRPECRKMVGTVASLVYQRLADAKEPGELVRTWLAESDMASVLESSHRDAAESVAEAASITTRSHFLSPRAPIARLETDLRRTTVGNSGCASVLVYQPWQYEPRVEPNEYVVDLYVDGGAKAGLIGRFIAWVMRELDYEEESRDDMLGLLCKRDIEGAYARLLARAVQVAYQDVSLELSAWPLGGLGIFPGEDSADHIRVWASNADLRSPFVKHMLRRRTRVRTRGLRSIGEELQGLVALVKRLRRETRAAKRRVGTGQRFLILTCSVRLTRGSETLMEFDGGVVRVDLPSGKMVFYGLETKGSRSASHAVNSLQRRLRQKMGIDAPARKLGRRSAFVQLEWG